MSEQSKPPIQPIAPPPQVGFASYPRANVPTVYGSSEKLSRAYRGYHGFSYTLILTISAYVAWIGGAVVMTDSSSSVGGILLLLVALVLTVGTFYMSIRSSQDLAFACGWTSIVGIVFGIFGPLIGVIGLGIFQFLAVNEMKNYGLGLQAFRGIRKKDYLAILEELQQYERSSPVATTI